jgi:hypothetical protein
MYDPVYLVEIGNEPLFVIQVGALTEFVAEEDPSSYCTVWLVDESGEAVRMMSGESL